MRKQKGFGLIGIIIVVVVIALLGGGGLYYYRNRQLIANNLQPATNNKSAEESKQTTQTSAQTASSTEFVDTSNWKIYRNEKYGFEVKYPPKWRFYEVNKEIIEMHEGTGVSDFGSFEIIADSDFLKVVSGHLARYEYGTKIQKEEMITVGDESGKLIYQNTGGQNLPDSSLELSRWFFIPHGGKIFKIGIYWRNKERDDFFNHMISTFKFLN